MIRNKCPLNDRHVYPSMAHIECFTCRLFREYREMLCFLLFDKRYIAVIHKLSIKLASYRLDRKINVNTQCRCDSMLKKSIVIILIIILIGIGIFSVMHLFSSSTDSNGDTPISNEKKEPDKDRSEEHTSELQSRFDLVCR